MMKKILVSAAAVILSLPTAGFAAISEQHKAFGEGPAQYYMTKQEKKEWEKVRTDAEAERFIELFWARRDPTPQTAVNEFRMGFDARVKIADENFTQGRVPGSMTDRGKVFITLGGATRRQRTGNSDSVSSIDSGFIGQGQADQVISPRPTETWTYSGDQVPAFAPSRAEFKVVFVDQHQNGEYTVNRGGRADVGDLIERAASSSIAIPDLTWDKLQAMRTAQAPQAPTAPEVEKVRTEFTNAALAAIARGMAADAKPMTGTWLNWGEYITGGGEYFVPVQFYLTPKSGVTAASELTLFGEVRDAEGNVILIVEEPVKLSESKGDFYAGTSLALEPAKTYTGVFGLAAGDKPVALTRTDLKLEGVTKGTPGVSQLILSDNIFALTEPQMPDDPYSFGGIRVVPKGDRTFTTADDLWYFYEVRNPTIDPATGQPALQSSIEVEGTTSDGKKRTMRSPLSEVRAEPLRGVEGHYGVGSSIPLTSFAPGKYTFTIKLLDTAQKPSKSWTMKETFEVVPAN